MDRGTRGIESEEDDGEEELEDKDMRWTGSVKLLDNEMIYLCRFVKMSDLNMSPGPRSGGGSGW